MTIEAHFWNISVDEVKTRGRNILKNWCEINSRLRKQSIQKIFPNLLNSIFVTTQVKTNYLFGIKNCKLHINILFFKFRIYIIMRSLGKS